MISFIAFITSLVLIIVRKQKTRLYFLLIPGYSEFYFLISLLHLNKIIGNGIYDMSDPVWNKSFYFNHN